MFNCPNCGFESETVNQRLRRLFVAGRTERSATVNRRNPDASRNELAVAMAAANAEDVVDPRSARVELRRAVGFIEFKGEEPERFDEFTGPMGGGK